MATEVECTSSLRLGESSKLVEHDDESDGLVDSGDVPPSMSAKKWKCVRKLLEHIVFISTGSYLEAVQVDF